MPTRTLTELAALCGAVVDGDGSRTVDGPAALGEAGPREISFLANPRYRSQLAATRAGAILVAPDIERPRQDVVLLRVRNPNKAFTAIVSAFIEPDPTPVPGVHSSAVVDPEAAVAPSASIGPFCWVGPGAVIGERAVLHASVSVGAGAQVGEDTVLHSGVRIYPRVKLGARVLLHSGCVIGSDGFGFEPTPDGWTKIPQVGTVVVEDDVEMGALCAVDRGRFGATRIGRGTKFDNLVHIAHNVTVGEASLVIAQSALAGSVKVGKRVIIAGQAGIAGHVEIGDGARIGAQSGVANDVPAGLDYLGTPAHPRGEALRIWSLTARLPELAQRVRDLEKKLAVLERSFAGAGEDSP
ncbi:MAG: UDP-3-O-(3-hydroxymyristoyl)glucosamine N-acyltransferase [Planctomycetes bacterium]|nr:UDP-3-O-(3-hydroxymyristoyl)glucosamine N-acyltransferase [Planctomycetota bacterium]